MGNARPPKKGHPESVNTDHLREPDHHGGDGAPYQNSLRVWKERDDPHRNNAEQDK